MYYKWRDLFEAYLIMTTIMTTIIIMVMVLNDNGPETGLNYICSLNKYKFQFHHFWSLLMCTAW